MTKIAKSSIFCGIGNLRNIKHTWMLLFQLTDLLDLKSISQNSVCSLLLGGFNFVLNCAEWMAQIYR